MVRRHKLSKLVAVFDHFHGAIAHLKDSTAKNLVENWVGIRSRYVMPVGGPRSAFAAGMEQALRETPMIMRSMQLEARKSAAQALRAAISAHYPEFLIKDAERLLKIRARGSIRGENEFYLVRHHVDALEGDSGQEEQLQILSGLLDNFESRRK